jgi:hypothetical protein
MLQRRKGRARLTDVLVHDKEGTRPRKDPKSVRSQAFVEALEAFLRPRPTDGGRDVWVEIGGRVLDNRPRNGECVPRRQPVCSVVI